ncbi:transposase [Variovorax paradoxus]|nr:transposase [Variovorax paradoxus]
MPAPRINLRKIRDVLRLKLEARLSHERIAVSLGISKGVVAKYVSLATVAGLDWATVQTLSDTALERRVVQGRLDRPTHYVLPDYGRAHQELRRKGMTLMLLWEEYVAAHPGQPTYRYSQFCERYRRYALRLKRSMRQIHRAGEKLFVDLRGPHGRTRRRRSAHIFVAALGASSYTFACATPRETMVDWLQGCARALSFIGGVPQLIVPDNPRAMIASPNRYDFVFGELAMFNDFAARFHQFSPRFSPAEASLGIAGQSPAVRCFRCLRKHRSARQRSFRYAKARCRVVEKPGFAPRVELEIPRRSGVSSPCRPGVAPHR